MNRRGLLIKAGIGVILLVAMFIFVFSWQSVGPDEEGFMYRPNDGGVDSETAYYEGSYFIAPWNQIVTYSIATQSRDWGFEGNDANGDPVSIWVKFKYSVKMGEAAKLHLKFGPDYEKFVLQRLQGVLKTTISNYSKEYFVEDNYTSLEESMLGQLSRYLDENHLKFYELKVTSVDL